AATRLYYACYYVVGALLVQNGMETQTHNGTINQLGLHFVRTGLLSAEQGKFYKQLFELRQNQTKQIKYDHTGRIQRTGFVLPWYR
ncbi:MAG: hypothetical protein ABFD10_23805, partial [Prolixibacteraceae bacterium]